MLRRCSRAGVLLIFASLFAFSQDKTTRVLDTDSTTEQQNERAERQKWFREGRTPADPSVSSAELLNRAQEQRQVLRAQRRALATARASAKVSATQTVSASWQLLGPGPMVSSDDPNNFQDYGHVSGRVTAVAIDQSDATGNTVYIGGAYGGVWKSTNAAGSAGSVSWKPLTDDQATLAVGAIALSPDGNTLLVGTGEPDNAGDSYYGLGILRSTNAKSAAPTFTQIPSTVEGVKFRGVGFAHFAWNTKTPTNVVASVANTSANLGSIATGNTNVGLFFSNDAGATWHQASVNDGGVAVNINSITGVAYNPLANNGAGAYYAAVRFHGIFVSTDDGQNWTRLSGQPGTITATCPTSGVSTCVLYRAEIAVTPGINEMFVWFVDVNEANQSVWVSRDSGATWTDLGTGGQMSACGDSLGSGSIGCGTDQGTYNLELAAIPTATGTDLYAGAINIFKCSVATGGTGPCNWLNTTHVYGCSPLAAPSHVHPDQHAIDFLRSNPDIMVFGNDGGVYRSLTASTGIASGACTAVNSYDNLNTNLALTQFVWFAQDQGADQTIIGGTQDNGSPAINPVVASASQPQLWTSYLGGDGGFTVINPANPNEWLLSEPNTQIFRTTVGVNSRGIITNSAPVVTPTTVGGDDGAFYTPFMMDSRTPGRLLVGTCRVWRGNSDGTGFTAISPNFSTTSATVCSNTTHTTIRSLATGGAGNATGASVVYAGTSAANPGKGSIFVSTNANTASPTWNNRTGTINPSGYEISSITVDDADSTGKTAFITIMGFGGGHVFRTTDAGVNWANITGDLPDAPATSFALDPGDPNTWYVATDTGVYMSSNGGANWTEYGPASGAGTLPNVALTHLETINTSTTHKLRVSTYGRGVWQAELASGGKPVPDFTVAPSGASSQSVAKGGAGAYTISVAGVNGFTSSVTFACSGLPALTTCTFSPTSVAPGTTTSLSIKTTASTTAQLHPFGGQIWALGLFLPGIVVIGMGRRKRGAALILTLMLAALVTMPACGGGGGGATSAPPPVTIPGTPAGTYTVTVSATSGSLTHSTQVTLTVQ